MSLVKMELLVTNAHLKSYHHVLCQIQLVEEYHKKSLQRHLVSCYHSWIGSCGTDQGRGVRTANCSRPSHDPFQVQLFLYGTQDSSQHWPCMFGMQWGHCPLKRVGLQGSGPIVHWWSRKRRNPSCLSHEVGDHALGLRVKPLRCAGPSSGGRAHARLLLVAFILQ